MRRSRFYPRSDLITAGDPIAVREMHNLARCAPRRFGLAPLYGLERDPHGARTAAKASARSRRISLERSRPARSTIQMASAAAMDRAATRARRGCFDAGDPDAERRPSHCAGRLRRLLDRL